MSVLKKLLIPLAIVAVLYFVISHLTRSVAIVSEVTRGKAIMAVPASITVQAENVSPIVSEVGGRIKTEGYNLDPGARVKAGDVLAFLDTTTLVLEIERTKGELLWRRAGARLTRARVR